jgi:transposase
LTTNQIEWAHVKSGGKMSGPKPIPIELSDAERRALQQLVRRHHVRQQIALRARIVLAAAEGQGNAAIARTLHTTLDTVRLWRRRWVDLQPIALEDLTVEERLEDLPRPGAPARITPEQVCRITALACEQPADSARPITQWTARELADELIQRKIVTTISPRHAARLLKRCRPQAAFGARVVNARTG